jgi:hypothetical protein
VFHKNLSTVSQKQVSVTEGSVGEAADFIFFKPVKSQQHSKTVQEMNVKKSFLVGCDVLILCPSSQ